MKIDLFSKLCKNGPLLNRKQQAELLCKKTYALYKNGPALCFVPSFCSFAFILTPLHMKMKIHIGTGCLHSPSYNIVMSC
jgi:hypothetical protein